MTVSARERHAVDEWFRGQMGPERARTLMQLLGRHDVGAAGLGDDELLAQHVALRHPREVRQTCSARYRHLGGRRSGPFKMSQAERHPAPRATTTDTVRALTAAVDD